MYIFPREKWAARVVKQGPFRKKSDRAWKKNFQFAMVNTSYQSPMGSKSSGLSNNIHLVGIKRTRLPP
jgi:hypothetical protein